LTQVTMPSSVIGDRAFHGCSRLTQVPSRSGPWRFVA
jgi:hypothetical protein